MTPMIRAVVAVSALVPGACAVETPPPPSPPPVAARPPMVTRPVQPAPAPTAVPPPKVAEAPAPTPAPPPAPKPAAKASPAPPSAMAPAKPKPPEPSAPPAKPPPAAPVAAAPAPLDLKSLEQRLKDTSAIGVLTKLSLKNQVDDLVGRFRAYHQGERPPTLADLKPAFDLLLMKVLSLLQDHDAALARDINASRDAIWGVLTDPRKLAQFA